MLVHQRVTNGNIATGQLCETCLNAQHVSLESFLVTGPIPETNHPKNKWPHSIGNAQTIQNCCPYVFIFFAAYILRTRSSVLQIESLPISDCHLRVQKIGAIIFQSGDGILPISSDQIPTNSPLDCTGQQNHHVPPERIPWNFLPKSPWTPNLIASYITMFHPKKKHGISWHFLQNFLPLKSPKEVTRWNEDFSPAKEIRLFLRAFRRACRCLQNARRTLDFTDGISENWWF